MKPVPRILRRVGVLLVLLGAGIAVGPARLVMSSTRVDGTVVDMRGKVPVVQFRAGSAIIRGQMKGGADARRQKGEVVTLYYQSDVPERFVAANFGQLWMGPLLAVCAGLVVLVVARKAQAG
jgi:hypothetical protein